MLGVVVAYFNPYNNEYRRKNTLQFLEYLSTFDDIEVALAEEVHENEPIGYMGKRHIRVYPETLIWRKENLFNIGANLFSDKVDAIAWVDADLEFLSDKWPSLTLKALDKADVVQMFELAAMLGPTTKPESLSIGIVKTTEGFSTTHVKEGFGLTGHPGLAWAMRRTAFNRIGGLFEYSIVGDGDMDMLCALGLVHSSRLVRSSSHMTELRKWAVEVMDLSVSYVPVSVNHFWHGPFEERQYTDRKKILVAAEYVPWLDVIKTADGFLELTERGRRLEKPIANYFVKMYGGR